MTPNPYEEAIKSCQIVQADLAKCGTLLREARQKLEEANPAPLFREAANSWRDFAGACLIGFIGSGILFVFMLASKCS